jgi:hypothetical protein
MSEVFILQNDEPAPALCWLCEDHPTSEPLPGDCDYAARFLHGATCEAVCLSCGSSFNRAAVSIATPK